VLATIGTMDLRIAAIVLSRFDDASESQSCGFQSGARARY
jgi:hypothetical protein